MTANLRRQDEKANAINGRRDFAGETVEGIDLGCAQVYRCSTLSSFVT